jgi:UPF0271 protein
MKDINCDLGEGESAAKTRALLRYATSANIACGGHAGDFASMDRCLRLCAEMKVNAGAHPGHFDRENFGRMNLPISSRELTILLSQQIGALQLIATSRRIRLRHVKLHGALYHQVDQSAELTKAYLDFIASLCPGLRVIALAGGRVHHEAKRRGMSVWGEAFAERRYREDGTLAPRSEDGSVLESPEEIRRQLAQLISQNMADTICVHSDSPQATRTLKIVAGALGPGGRKKR